MTETTTAQEELVDARREVAELKELIGGLEEKVRAGEAEQAEQELTAQYGLERLARLRAEAAEKRVRDAEAAEVQGQRLAAVEAARAELADLSPERLAFECEAALQAIERVQRLGDARQAAVERHARVFLGLEMRDLIRHEDSGWIVFEVDGVRYDTRQDGFTGSTLLGVIEGERSRRAQIPGRAAKGFPPPEPGVHPMAQLLAANAAAEPAGGAEL